MRKENTLLRGSTQTNFQIEIRTIWIANQTPSSFMSCFNESLSTAMVEQETNNNNSLIMSNHEELLNNKSWPSQSSQNQGYDQSYHMQNQNNSDYYASQQTHYQDFYSSAYSYPNQCGQGYNYGNGYFPPPPPYNEDYSQHHQHSSSSDFNFGLQHPQSSNFVNKSADNRETVIFPWMQVSNYTLNYSYFLHMLSFRIKYFKYI